jgi:hypothetical protein
VGARERRGHVAADHERGDRGGAAQRVLEGGERPREDEPVGDRAVPAAVEPEQDRDDARRDRAPDDEERGAAAAGDEPAHLRHEQQCRAPMKHHASAVMGGRSRPSGVAR